MTSEERAYWQTKRRALLMEVAALDKLLESAQQVNDRPARVSVPADTTEPAPWPPSRRSERAS
jgi:hypothetical protein